MSGTRLHSLDNVKFLLIALVVLGHFLLSRTDLALANTLVLLIYSFHMPAFAFVSGHLSQSPRSRSAEKIAQLVVAYVVFNGLFVIWAAFRGSDVLITYPYYSMWYLIALVIWRLTAPHVARVRFALPISAALAVLIGFWPDAGNVFAFGRIVAFYPFFLAGYLMPRSIPESLAAIPPKRRIPIALIAIAIAAAAVLALRFGLHCTIGQLEMDPYERLRDAGARIAILAAAAAATAAIVVAAPNREIPFATMIGRNSLSVYLVHRLIVLGYDKVVAPRVGTALLVATALAGTAIVLIALGNDRVAGAINSFLAAGASLITREKTEGKLALASKVAVIGVALLSAVAPVRAYLGSGAKSAASAVVEDPLYERLDTAEATDLDSAYTILFAGDLILLEDQVRNAYNGETYDFSQMFEYTAPYIQAADLAIGVFEGPCAGERAGYSQGNFDDGKPLKINFPDEFATAVSEAGFDLVTTANNHLLDCGEEGALRTLSVLDGAGLAHTGSYATAEAKEAGAVHVVQQGELKVAVLSYTYGVNDGSFADYPDETFVSGEYAHLTSLIAAPGSAAFDACKAAVEADFARARELGCDLIVVLPHWGTQFAFEPDEAQRTWRQIFLDNGADIIFGDHTHSVQPIVMEEVDGRQTLTVYCPGNYANVYRGHDGDASALVEVYVDRASNEIKGGAVIPMWTEAQLSGNYRPLPVASILTDEKLRGEISTYDLDRVSEVHKLITRVMLGTELDLTLARDRLRFTASGFERSRVPQIEITDAMREGAMYQALSGAGDVCFVGDSITEGTRNGGYAWYEPIEGVVTGTVANVSLGGATTNTLLGMTESMVEAHSKLYVVAIGTNDVRYRDASQCAMTPEDYVANLSQLVETVRAGVPDARFAFIAPWTSTAGDLNTALYVDEKREMYAEYTAALKSWCEAEGHLFSDPNPAIEAVIDFYPQKDYLVDFIHPNSTKGIELYARCVLES